VARRRTHGRRDDSGATTVEIAVLLPLMLLLLMAVVQVGLWFHVRAVMTTAANKAVDATRSDAATTADGEQAATEFLTHTAALDDIVIDVDRGPEGARAEISGEVVSLMFGAPITVTVVAEAPIETIEP